MQRTLLVAALLPAATLPAYTEDATVSYKSLAPDVALDMARAALDRCRKDGFQVAVTVIDRFGQPLVVLRDRFAGLGAISTATGKAWTAVNFGRDTGELFKAMQAGQFSTAYSKLPNVVILAGGDGRCGRGRRRKKRSLREGGPQRGSGPARFLA